MHVEYQSEKVNKTGNVVQCNNKALASNYCYRGKAISILYSECVSVALVTQHAVRMRHIILSSVICPAVPYFSTFSYKRQGVWKMLLKIKCVCDYVRNFCLKHFSF
jgi:hypothetical protein